jgi:micrococcal nuclease
MYPQRRSIIILFPVLPFLLVSAVVTTAQPIICTKVIDGNTIVLSNGEKVRLIGVDIPETKHSNRRLEDCIKEASAFTRKMVEGKTIKLAYDWQQRDKYGSLLAYVYLTDGTFLNAEIIKQGYGHAYTRFPFKYLDEFRQYEREAQEAKKGLWADEASPEERKLIKEKYIGSKKSKVYHLPHCTLAQKLISAESSVFNTVKEAVDAGYVPCKICRPPYHK